MIFNQSILEPDGQLVSVEANLSASVDARIAFGVVARGTLIPPSLSDLGIFASKARNRPFAI